ncbi:NAD(P)H-binding protein [Acidicapsa ligni]|uniref:NAD(P)H-binding protein n=1 Tax=Acidicapsa ligni TaxID=542300 RepID=UPI0021DF5593|nr:NAD(P)H-binding protein [Acidicapsa ligni]
MKVFILGITGRTGNRIAQLLISQGHAVSGLYRRASDVSRLQDMGIHAVSGDIATIREHDLAKAIAGTDVLVFTAGAGEQDDESMIDAVDYGGVKKSVAALRLAGLSRLLLVSVFPEAAREKCFGGSFEHYMSAKKKADVEVANSGLDWVILRPSSLKDDPGTGRVSLGLANFHTEITRDDLASTVVALLNTPRITKKILELTEGDDPIASAVSAIQLA